MSDTHDGNPEDKNSALAATELFGGLKNRHLDLIARVTDRIEIPAGHELIRQGQNMTHMSIVASGTADATVDGAVVGHVGPGDVVGELSLIDEAEASATVTATEPMVLWHIARAGFIPVWDKNRGEISTAMLLAVTKKLRETNKSIAG